jgi:DNA-directed RNA polymerase subunit N (RpoN/RPB10)
MAYRLIRCNNCQWFFGDDHALYLKYLNQGYSRDQALDMLGPLYEGQANSCCRQAISCHYENTSAGINYMNQRMDLLRHHKSLGSVPYFYGLNAEPHHMYHDTTLNTTQVDYSELERIL